MSIFTCIYNIVVNSGRRPKIIWSLIRRAIIHIVANKAECRMMVHGFMLTMPFSHQLPLHLSEFPFYDSLPSRIASFVRSNYGYFNCIDVGANIGDTLAAFKAKSREDKNISSNFIAIEPNPHYRKFLENNWGNESTIMILSCLCSSNEGEAEAVIHEKHGTAAITASSTFDVNRIRKFDMRTVDSLANEYKKENGYNVIKVDTDGHDYDVLMGSRKLIEENKPFVLFELDNFNDDKFAQKITEIFSLFQESGYKRFLVYDSYGYLMGIYSLDDILSFYSLIFYKLTSKFKYFDLLFIAEKYIDEFYKEEMRVFADNPENNPADAIAANHLIDKLRASKEL